MKVLIYLSIVGSYAEPGIFCWTVSDINFTCTMLTCFFSDNQYGGTLDSS